MFFFILKLKRILNSDMNMMIPKHSKVHPKHELTTRLRNTIPSEPLSDSYIKISSHFVSNNAPILLYNLTSFSNNYRRPILMAKRLPRKPKRPLRRKTQKLQMLVTTILLRNQKRCPSPKKW